MRTVLFTALHICLKMAVFEIFAQPELRRYKTHACSKAVLFQICVLLLTYIPPILVAYKSRGKIANLPEFGPILFGKNAW
jgi:hypothetical protein